MWLAAENDTISQYRMTGMLLYMPVSDFVFFYVYQAVFCTYIQEVSCEEGEKVI